MCLKSVAVTGTPLLFNNTLSVLLELGFSPTVTIFLGNCTESRYPLPKNNTKETFVPCCSPQGWLYSSDPNDLLVYFVYNSRQFNRTVSWLLACCILTDLSMFLDTFCQNVQILELSLQPFSVVGTPYQQGAGSLGMSMDNSGVVGKFRSFYSTIEQVRSFLFFLALRVSTNKSFFCMKFLVMIHDLFW